MNYITELPTEEKKMFVIDVCAQWCGHCRSLAPFLDKAEQDNPDVTFLKIDADKASNELLDKLEVNELPLIFAYKNGKVVSKYNEKDGSLDSWCKFIQW